MRVNDVGVYGSDILQRANKQSWTVNDQSCFLKNYGRNILTYEDYYTHGHFTAFSAY